MRKKRNIILDIAKITHYNELGLKSDTFVTLLISYFTIDVTF